MSLPAALAVLAHFYCTNDALSRQSLEKDRAHISMASPVRLTVAENGKLRSTRTRRWWLGRGSGSWLASFSAWRLGQEDPAVFGRMPKP